jgi:hypothetical protein
VGQGSDGGRLLIRNLVPGAKLISVLIAAPALSSKATYFETQMDIVVLEMS